MGTILKVNDVEFFETEEELDVEDAKEILNTQYRGLSVPDILNDGDNTIMNFKIETGEKG